jgi:CRISPR-associated protein Cas1
MASGALGHCHSSQNISAEEAKLARQLYKLAANTMSYGDFARAKHGSGADFANRFLDHGNYLAYSLGATTTWVLGLPHGPAVLHDKTRRGGLIFDVADLIKDALILSQAFIAAMAGAHRQLRRAVP